MDLDLLRNIFLDAHVLDIDFSDWDTGIRLLVVGTELPVDSRNRLPLFIVEFQGVRDFGVTFAHLDNPLREGHYQWRAHTFSIDTEGAQHRVRLSGSKLFPTIALTCREIDVRPVDQDVLSKTFADWDHPGGPLVRPGIERAMRSKERRRPRGTA